MLFRSRQEKLKALIFNAAFSNKVAEITESDYFQRLRGQADQLRNIMERTDTLLEREV